MTRHYSSTATPTTLNSSCSDAASTVQVVSTVGFPAADYILALDYGTAQQELVLVTGVSGTTLTVTRGYDSTTAQAHSAGAAVQHVHAGVDFRDSRTHEAASSGVHGLTGAVVGTTDTQALTHKDLSDATNSFPSSLATDTEVASAVSTHAAATATHGASGALVGTNNVQALTNKDLTSGTNTFPASLATDTEVATAVSTHAALTTTHGVVGAIVGTTDTQLLSHKDLTDATNTFPATVVSTTGAQTLTNKTLASPVITGIGATSIVGPFNGLTFSSSSTSLAAVDSTFQSPTLDTNATYEVDLVVHATSDTNNDSDIKIGFTFPTGSTMTFGGHGPANTLASGSVATTEHKFNTSVTSGATSLSYGTSTNAVMIVIKGTLKTGSTAGHLTVAWGCLNVPTGGSFTNVLGTSNLRVTRTA